MNADRLKALCPPDGYGITKQPWRLDGWSFATNGRAMLALRGDHATEEPPTKSLKAALAVNTPRGTIIGVERLTTIREWIGEYEPPGMCQTCMGDGEVVCPECEQSGAECPDCDGGKAPAEPREGSLFGCPINGNLLAEYLDGLEADTAVTLMWDAGDTRCPLYVVTDDWRVAIMPMDAGRRGEPGLKTFGPPAEVTA